MIDNLTSGRNPPKEVFVFVEVPKDSRHKYRYDEEMKIIVLEKVWAKKFSGSYGFIPKTHSTDGSHLDAIVLSSETISPGVVVNSRPIGMIRTSHDEVTEDKIITVPFGDSDFEDVKDIKDLPKHIVNDLREMFDFGKGNEVFGREKAENSITRAIGMYKRGEA